MQNKNDTLPLLYREYWVLINVVHTCLFFFLCFHRCKTFTCCARVYSVVGHPQWLWWHCCWSLTWYFTTHSVIPASAFTPQWERKKDKRWTLLSMTTLHVHPAVDNIHSQWGSGGIIFVFIIVSKAPTEFISHRNFFNDHHLSVTGTSLLVSLLSTRGYGECTSERFMGSLWPRSSHLTNHRKLTTEEQHAFLCDNFYKLKSVRDKFTISRDTFQWLLFFTIIGLPFIIFFVIFSELFFSTAMVALVR